MCFLRKKNYNKTHITHDLLICRVSFEILKQKTALNQKMFHFLKATQKQNGERSISFFNLIKNTYMILLPLIGGGRFLSH